MNIESEYSRGVNDERERNFIKEFKELLSKYKAEIELKEKPSFYYSCGYTINIYFNGYPDGDECVSYRDLNIGNGTILSPDGSVTI